MSFVRSFDISRLNRLGGDNAELFGRLMDDIQKGDVFPAVRKGELHFYHMGGCLFKFNGSFVRDKNYDNYSDNTEGLSYYEKCKKQNQNKYTGVGGAAKERQLLDALNNHTFSASRNSKTVVLDIEVRLNGMVGGNKKCDMVLLNTETNEIMFVEGKVFSDGRVNNKAGSTPEVINQVNTYTAAISEQKDIIITQYAEHISIINKVLGTKYNPNISLVENAKLLVFETPANLNNNGRHSVDTISAELDKSNVVWYKTNEELHIDDIWNSLRG